jgi:hypothetical protein
MKKIINILIFVLLFIWQLPQNIIALIMFPFLGESKIIKYYNYCFVIEGTNMSGGISLGNFIFLSPYCAKRETTIAHEYGHVKQSWYLGPLFVLSVGISSLLWAAFKPNNKCYYKMWTESWANKISGLGVDSLCRLYFLDRPDYKK